LAALDHAAAMGWVDARRIGVMGLSYGGYMVNWLIGHSGRFCAAVSENGISNLLSVYGTSDGGWYFFPLELGVEPDEDPQRYRRLSPLSTVDRVQTRSCCSRARTIGTARLSKVSRSIRRSNGEGAPWKWCVSPAKVTS